jgi:hypothetical protein
MANNALVKRGDLSVGQAVKPDPGFTALATSGQTQSVDTIVVPLIKSENQDLYNLLERECNGSWHPCFRYGQEAIKSIAHCLIDVANPRYASLQTVQVPIKDEHCHRPKMGTLAADVDACLRKCVETIGSLTSIMYEVSTKADRLSIENGPVSLPLNLRRWLR